MMEGCVRDVAVVQGKRVQLCRGESEKGITSQRLLLWRRMVPFGLELMEK
jgi:hypothetical protein